MTEHNYISDIERIELFNMHTLQLLSFFLTSRAVMAVSTESKDNVDDVETARGGEETTTCCVT